MAEFKTPKKATEEKPPPIRIPPSPFLQELGYGCGMFLFLLIQFLFIIQGTNID